MEGLIRDCFDIFTSSLRMSTPLLFAALGGMLSERSGVINISLEGKMLTGAFFAACVAHWTGSPWFGLLGGISGGMAIAVVYAMVVIPFKANQIVAGTGINFLALGICPFFSNLFFESPGSTPNLNLDQRFGSELFFLVWVLVLLQLLWFQYSRGGLRLSMAGEKPEALLVNGIGVNPIRWKAILMSGLYCGLAGATLSIALSSSFSRNMTAGRGFMALAALILGRWKPIPTALACFFFGLADSLQIRLQGVQFPGGETVPVQFIQILPYVVTLIVLAGFFGGSRAPTSIGKALE
jgi:ABC-type uncharacterized transport system permease subunit